MTRVLAIHTAARRFAIESFQRWFDAYSDRTLATRDTDEALRLRLKHGIWSGILNEIESLDSEDLPEEPVLFDLLSLAGQTAEPLGVFREASEEDVASMDEERQAFQEFLDQLKLEPAIKVDPLPYRRVLPQSEAFAIWEQLNRRWIQPATGVELFTTFQGRKVTNWQGWYPPQERGESFLASQFAQAVPAPTLHQLLQSQQVHRVIELKELSSLEPHAEIDIEYLHPRYTGSEGYWTSKEMDWIIYASHEGSITVGGSLLPEIRLAWPEWSANLWTPRSVHGDR